MVVETDHQRRRQTSWWKDYVKHQSWLPHVMSMFYVDNGDYRFRSYRAGAGADAGADADAAHLQSFACTDIFYGKALTQSSVMVQTVYEKMTKTAN
jgi:hypothetical protein